jgi:hypothetical protein
VSSLEDIRRSPAYASCAPIHDGGIITERVLREALTHAREQSYAAGAREGDAEWSRKYDSMKLAAHKYRAKAKVRLGWRSWRGGGVVAAVARCWRRAHPCVALVGCALRAGLGEAAAGHAGEDSEERGGAASATGVLVLASLPRTLMSERATVACVSRPQKTIRDLEDEVQRQRREHREALMGVEGECDRLHREVANAKSQIRSAQEREEELQNQARMRRVGGAVAAASRAASPCLCLLGVLRRAHCADRRGAEGAHFVGASDAVD